MVIRCKYYSRREYIEDIYGYTEYEDYCSYYSDGCCNNHRDCQNKHLGEPLKIEWEEKEGE